MWNPRLNVAVSTKSLVKVFTTPNSCLHVHLVDLTTSHVLCRKNGLKNELCWLTSDRLHHPSTALLELGVVNRCFQQSIWCKPLSKFFRRYRKAPAKVVSHFFSCGLLSRIFSTLAVQFNQTCKRTNYEWHYFKAHVIWPLCGQNADGKPKKRQTDCYCVDSVLEWTQYWVFLWFIYEVFLLCTFMTLGLPNTPLGLCSWLTTYPLSSFSSLLDNWSLGGQIIYPQTISLSSCIPD